MKSSTELPVYNGSRNVNENPSLPTSSNPPIDRSIEKSNGKRKSSTPEYTQVNNKNFLSNKYSFGTKAPTVDELMEKFKSPTGPGPMILDLWRDVHDDSKAVNNELAAQRTFEIITEFALKNDLPNKEFPALIKAINEYLIAPKTISDEERIKLLISEFVNKFNLNETEKTTFHEKINKSLQEVLGKKEESTDSDSSDSTVSKKQVSALPLVGTMDRPLVIKSASGNDYSLIKDISDEISSVFPNNANWGWIIFKISIAIYAATISFLDLSNYVDNEDYKIAIKLGMLLLIPIISFFLGILTIDLPISIYRKKKSSQNNQEADLMAYYARTKDSRAKQSNIALPVHQLV